MFWLDSIVVKRLKSVLDFKLNLFWVTIPLVHCCWTCISGHDSVVKLLIDAHADLGKPNEVGITKKAMAFVNARIPMQHIEALCNACTECYASYGINSLPSSFSLTTFPPPSPLLSRLLCPQWQLWWHYCWHQRNTSDAVAVSLHPHQQVVWEKPD